MGLKDLDKKLRFLIEQEIDIEMEEVPEEGLVEDPAPMGPDISKDLDEIIRVSADLREKCVSLASLLP